MARRRLVLGLVVLAYSGVFGHAATPSGAAGEWVMGSGDNKTRLKVNELEFVWTYSDEFVLTVTRGALANGEASGTVRSLKVMGSGVEVTIAHPQPVRCKMMVVPDGLEVGDFNSPGDIKVPKESVEGLYHRE